MRVAQRVSRLATARAVLLVSSVLLGGVACGDAASPGGTTTTDDAAAPAPDSAVADGGATSTPEGGADATSATRAGPCSLGANDPVPAGVAPPGQASVELFARAFRGSPDPDPLRVQWLLDLSQIQVDVYPRGIPIDAWTFAMGGCVLHPNGAVTRSVPSPGGAPGDPPATESGSRFSGVGYDPSWSSFRFVPGARYAIEVKGGSALIARLVFRVPDDYPSLTFASRTELRWAPFSVASDDVVTVSGLHLGTDGYATKESVRISPPLGAATWNVTDPTVDHAYLSWGRNILVDGLPKKQSLSQTWIHAF